MDHAKACLLADLTRFRLPPRYTPAMVWEKVINRRETFAFPGRDGPVWAWGGVEEDEDEPSLYVQGEFLGAYGDHSRGLINYLNRDGTEWLTGPDTGYTQFCLDHGLWFDSEFLIRLTFWSGYSYEGEYDEEWDWDLMYTTPPAITADSLEAVVALQMTRWGKLM